MGPTLKRIGQRTTFTMSPCALKKVGIWITLTKKKKKLIIGVGTKKKKKPNKLQQLHDSESIRLHKMRPLREKGEACLTVSTSVPFLETHRWPSFNFYTHSRACSSTTQDSFAFKWRVNTQSLDPKPPPSFSNLLQIFSKALIHLFFFFFTHFLIITMRGNWNLSMIYCVTANNKVP